MQNHIQLYQSDIRGVKESEVFRRLSTFNFDDYNEDSRAPFGSLVAFNDETLGGGNTLFRHVAEPLHILTLPLVGGLIFKDSFGKEATIATGQIGWFAADGGNAYQLTNPFQDELVNYLHIWIKADSGPFETGSMQSDFSISQHNQLINLFDGSPLEKIGIFAHIGLYDGRKSDEYQLQNPQNGLFAFVLNGAFEFENRLLENRDGLAIERAESVEFEALSENAMLLLLEIPMDK